MRKIKKIRADILLCHNGHTDTTEKAARLIMAGKVRIGRDHLVRKPSETYPETAEFTIKPPFPFVSRGALKLKEALEKYSPSLEGKTALDVGASTGGFTDLMLQTGAARVYTVDSGKGQLHEKLRKNQKVICHEKVNARYLESGFLPEKIDVLTIDVSFISVTRVIPPVDKFLKKNGIAFILVKPQFEAERKNVMKGGVVKSTRIRAECVEKVSVFAEKQVGWRFIESLESPVNGPKGNRELMCVFFK